MADLLRVAARLAAFHQGRAVAVAGTKRLEVRPDVRALAVLKLAGEGAVLHAVAFGSLGNLPEVLVAPDPRDRAQHHALLTTLAAHFWAWFVEAQRQGSFPQLLVSSPAAVRLLANLRTDLWWPSRDSHELHRLRAMLGYLVDRSEEPGQLAVLPATDLLSEHFATGQDPDEDQHLAAQLEWHRDDPSPMLDRLEVAEQRPMGVSTRPEFDRRDLAPLLGAYGQAGEGSTAQDVLAGRIRDALTPILLDMVQAIAAAVEVLGRWDAPAAPWLPALENIERDQFAEFCRDWEAGWPIHEREFPVPAAIRLARRERLQEELDRARVYGDPISRAAARITGEVLAGAVAVAVAVRPPRARSDQARLTVLTPQPALKLRQGDEVASLDHPALRFVIERIERRDAAMSCVQFGCRRVARILPTSRRTDCQFGGRGPNQTRSPARSRRATPCLVRDRRCTTSRHTHLCLVFARAGIERVLENHVPLGDRPLGVDHDPEHHGRQVHLAFLRHLRETDRMVPVQA